DAVQPALEGAGLVVTEGAEHTHERLLGEVLRVVRVTGETEGQTVDAVGVFRDELAPAGHVPLTGIEGSGAGEVLRSGERGVLGVGVVSCSACHADYCATPHCRRLQSGLATYCEHPP